MSQSIRVVDQSCQCDFLFFVVLEMNMCDDSTCCECTTLDHHLRMARGRNHHESFILQKDQSCTPWGGCTCRECTTFVHRLQRVERFAPSVNNLLPQSGRCTFNQVVHFARHAQLNTGLLKKPFGLSDFSLYNHACCEFVHLHIALQTFLFKLAYKLQSM